MQHEKYAIHWFINMTEKEILDPLNPNLRLVPADVLSEFYWDTLPEGDVAPSQAAVTVSHFLFLSCRIILERQKGNRRPRELLVKASDIFKALDGFLILSGLEKLRREGLIDYHTNGGWHNGKGDIWISGLQPDAIELGSPFLKTFSN